MWLILAWDRAEWGIACGEVPFEMRRMVSLVQVLRRVYAGRFFELRSLAQAGTAPL